MERWTERFNSDGEKAIAIHDGSDFPYVCFEGEREFDVMNALAEYEDLEEQGLLVRLPDDLNRVLYQINYRWTKCTKYGERRNKCEIYSCERECDSREEYYIVEVDLRYIRIGNYYDRLGKFLFFTREEAEKKLEEIQNDKT